MMATVALVVATNRSDSSVDPDQDAALPTGGDGQTTTDQEGDPSEHLLLGEAGLGSEELRTWSANRSS